MNFELLIKKRGQRGQSKEDPEKPTFVIDLKRGRLYPATRHINIEKEKSSEGKKIIKMKETGNSHALLSLPTEIELSREDLQFYDKLNKIPIQELDEAIVSFSNLILTEKNKLLDKVSIKRLTMWLKELFQEKRLTSNKISLLVLYLTNNYSKLLKKYSSKREPFYARILSLWLENVKGVFLFPVKVEGNKLKLYSLYDLFVKTSPYIEILDIKFSNRIRSIFWYLCKSLIKQVKKQTLSLPYLLLSFGFDKPFKSIKQLLQNPIFPSVSNPFYNAFIRYIFYGEPTFLPKKIQENLSFVPLQTFLLNFFIHHLSLKHLISLPLSNKFFIYTIEPDPKKRNLQIMTDDLLKAFTLDYIMYEFAIRREYIIPANNKDFHSLDDLLFEKKDLEKLSLYLEKYDKKLLSKPFYYLPFEQVNEILCKLKE